MTTTNGVPPGSHVYALIAARPSSSSTADMTAKVPSGSGNRRRGSFVTTPRASRSNDASIGASASSGAMSRATSSSFRYRVISG
jgi:hypothetical protein